MTVPAHFSSPIYVSTILANAAELRFLHITLIHICINAQNLVKSSSLTAETHWISLSHACSNCVQQLLNAQTQARVYAMCLNSVELHIWRCAQPHEFAPLWERFFGMCQEINRTDAYESTRAEVGKNFITFSSHIVLRTETKLLAKFTMQ